MPDCKCSETASRFTFATDGAAAMGNNRDAVLAGTDEIARAPEKYQVLYRCRTCGMYWLEGLYDHGMVMFEYIFPVTPIGDPERWLHEEAADLPSVAASRLSTM